MRASSTERALLIAFFASGAAGLIFEVVWFYQCGLVFGQSVWATSIVLSSFMAGLALGNALVALYAPRVHRLLATYALLEAVAAASGLAITYALTAFAGLLSPITRPFDDAFWLVNLVRLVMAFAFLAIPATAMGATLPLLVGALSRSRPGFGRALGLLYGWNTLGAVAGVVGAEVVLIARFGVTGTAWLAAFFDLTAAGIAIWISRRTGESPSLSIAAPAVSRHAPSRLPRRLLTCAFLAGGALMALEVVWFRFLLMFVTNSTLAVSLMLAVVLSGIGLGGLVASGWTRRGRNVESHVPAVAFMIGCVTVGSYWAFQYVSGDGRAGEWYRILSFALAITFPAALLSGVLFTLLGEAVKSTVALEEKAAGLLALANTTGALCGPLLAAFVLLPFFGMERSFFALAIVYGLIGIVAILDTSPQRRRFSSFSPGGAALIAVLTTALFPFGLMSSSYFARAAAAHTVDGSEVIATREGSAETIFLLQQTWMGEPIYHRLVTNGFSMSGTAAPGKRYMRHFVYLPMLLRQEPLRRVLVICYGVGVTAGAVKDLPAVESIDVVEISRDIVAMSDRVYSADDHPLRDPRVRLHLEDGRYFLQTTTERFDLITGEPPPLLTPGSVNLYTREYFLLIHDRLAAGGIATYWLPVARQEGADHTAIIRAFCDVFSDCSLWNGTPSDLMLVGTRGASGPVPAAHLTKAWEHPVVGSRLREAGFELPPQIGATFVADAASLRARTAAAVPLTDDFPRRLRLPFGAVSPSDPRALFDRGGPHYFREVLDAGKAKSAFETSEFVRRLWPPALIRETLPFFESQRIINRVLSEGANPLRQIEDLHHVLTQTDLEKLPLWILGLGNHPILERAAAMPNDGTGQVEYVLGLRGLAARHYLDAASYLAEAERRGLPGVRALLVYALCLAERTDIARQLSSGVEPSTPDARHFWSWMQSEFGVGPTPR
jgi:predicted membrane-bound spermidine synthase